jgi:transketolase N-terminal domain/subunit
LRLQLISFLAIATTMATTVETIEERSLEPQTTKRSDNQLAVLTIRSLVSDLCNQHGSGHGGSAIGMAAIGVALWKYVMRYNPADPNWFDRDRFVLSNGEQLKQLF